MPPARVDANQLELAILNLAINARDAMPDGGSIEIKVAECKADTDPALRPGRYLKLSVIDNGKGMTPEILKRAVEPFFSSKPLGKGTGLGLSMVHGLAVQLGGSLQLSSAVAKGTTATLILPVATELAGVTVTGLSRRVGWSAPVVLVAVGAVVSFIPGVPHVELQPELVLYGLLPPLLFAASIQTSFMVRR